MATRKTAAQSKKTDADGNEPKMMDPDAVEVRTPSPIAYGARNAYALGTLVEEVHALYDTAEAVVVDYNGRNVGLSVQFNVDSDEADLLDLLKVIESDERVMDVVSQNEHTVLVSFWNNARTQDSREPFNLREALAVLREAEDPTKPDTDDDTEDQS